MVGCVSDAVVVIYDGRHNDTIQRSYLPKNGQETHLQASRNDDCNNGRLPRSSGGRIH
jgi:hypothetical protein